MPELEAMLAIGCVLGLGILFAIRLLLVPQIQADTAMRDGYPAVAQVIEIRQTGVTLNQIPLMYMVLRVHDAWATREVTIRQYVDLGNMPRVSEHVRVMVDRHDARQVAYVGLVHK